MYGSPEEPWLALQLTETEPTCRSLGVSGEERSLELTNSLGEPVEWMTEPLEGLLDSENRLTVTLADVDLKQGLQPKSPYCETRWISPRRWQNWNSIFIGSFGAACFLP